MADTEKKVLVVFSGGMDSTTLLYWIRTKYKNIEAISFNYGSKHNKKELECAKYHTNKLGIKHKIINLNLNKMGFKSNLLTSGGKIPEGNYNEDNMKSTVVPFRNGIMLAIAAGYAESIGAQKVLLGSHSGDHVIYPDCRKEFTQAMNLAVYLGTENNIEIESPFNNLMKWNIAKLGENLGIDYSKTWSCYKGKDKHCGKCGTCMERKEAFKKSQVEDPTEYMEE